MNCVDKVVTFWTDVFYIYREMVACELCMFVDDQGNVSNAPSEWKI
jgi:hypothetical protein